VKEGLVSEIIVTFGYQSWSRRSRQCPSGSQRSPFQRGGSYPSERGSRLATRAGPGGLVSALLDLRGHHFRVKGHHFRVEGHHFRVEGQQSGGSAFQSEGSAFQSGGSAFQSGGSPDN
jgi:hypothetical protein